MDISFSITKKFNVDSEVVAKIAEDFAEWLEAGGYRLTWHSSRSEEEESSYEDLAKKFATSLVEKFYD